MAEAKQITLAEIEGIFEITGATERNDLLVLSTVYRTDGSVSEFQIDDEGYILSCPRGFARFFRPGRLDPDTDLNWARNRFLVQDWHFTFGPDNRPGGVSGSKRYVVVRGKSEDARAAMLARYGRDWSSCYPTAQAAGVEKFGLVQLGETIIAGGA